MRGEKGKVRTGKDRGSEKEREREEETSWQASGKTRIVEEGPDL